MKPGVMIAALCGLAMCVPSTALAQSPPAEAAAVAPTFTLKPLPYAPSALAPVIDELTMTIHHGRHHRSYVDALNRLVAADPKLQGLSLHDLLAQAGRHPAAVRNNAGGHWNHEFFWDSMTAPDTSAAPSASFIRAVNQQFGSLDAMKAQLKAAGLGRFGSGWVWLVVQPGGELAITTTPNQDNPLMDVAEVRGDPILGNDLWEHAYYLNYQNKRGDYLDAWWRVVDWSVISARYAAAAAKSDRD